MREGQEEGRKVWEEGRRELEKGERREDDWEGWERHLPSEGADVVDDADDELLPVRIDTDDERVVHDVEVGEEQS